MKKQKSEAIYPFSLKKLKPEYELEKKETEIRLFLLEFSVCLFFDEEEKNPRVEL